MHSLGSDATCNLSYTNVVSKKVQYQPPKCRGVEVLTTGKWKYSSKVVNALEDIRPSVIIKNYYCERDNKKASKKSEHRLAVQLKP